VTLFDGVGDGSTWNERRDSGINLCELGLDTLQDRDEFGGDSLPDLLD